jgi:hypothetical protein
MFKKLFNKKVKKTPAERFLEHWEKAIGKTPDLFRGESLTKNLPAVSTLVFRDFPEKGMVTGITYGLSLARHPNWKHGRPELVITMEADDLAWPLTAGIMANRLRGDCPFSYGNTINFGEPIAEGSPLESFFVFAPASLEEKDYVDIEIGKDYKITVAGLYPIYATEIQKINDWGMEKFWKHPGYDLYNPKRRELFL